MRALGVAEQFPDIAQVGNDLRPVVRLGWLHRFGIAPLPNPFRIRGRQARGYERAAFEDAFRRYA